MFIAYKSINLSNWKSEMIQQVNDVIRDYKAQGYNLTLRQVYYQFVSRDWLPERWADKATGSTNNERSYKNLGDLISDGRLCGLISWDAIEDRTREVVGNSHWDDPSSIMRGAAQSFALDKWSDQPCRVEIWVEKDALEGVIARPAKNLDISYFSCRGYTSQTAMHDAAMRLKSYIEGGQKVVVLHLGDHDPSGIDMTRDIEDRLNLFLGNDADDFELRRIALNMNQIKQYNPPPNPAKITDSRAAGYIEKHGVSSWELDALEPRVITKLINDHVLGLRDLDLWDNQRTDEKHHINLLNKAAANWGEVADYLENI